VTIRGPLAITLFAALILSVAVNLAVAGFVVARLHDGPPPPGSEVERIVSMGTRGFPPEIQKAIADGAKAKRDEIRQRLDDVQAARRQMFEAMRADPFDAAALDAAYANLRDKTTVLQEAGQQIVAQAVAGAPADVRARIKPPRGGPGRSDGPPPPPP
jgi:uncharacterized membrane protein